tara:strand:+ start:651 stop:1256 length:606 start_codon:yes stop_codon:yes gene_type:complete
MSQIKLKHSGGNSVIIAAPDSNPASDRTLKLPSDGDGTIISSNSHKPIVNYAQTVKTDTFSASVAQGSQSGDAIFIDYAATASTNKLLVSCSLSVGSSTVNRFGCFFCVGGVIQSAFRGDTAGGRKTLYIAGNISQTYVMTNLAGEALISSPSTNSTRYSFRLIHGNNATSTVYLNRTHEDNDENYLHRAVSTITIKEIAP